MTSEPVTVWVLDIVGYDARGGNAKVFSSIEKAKASVPHVKWKRERDEWVQDHGYEGSLMDVYVLAPVVVDAAASEAAPPLTEASGAPEHAANRPA